MFDAVVVGARCAGAATAMLLSRRGRKILMIDQDSLPSDKPMSTHLIWQAGVACLKRWGLLDQLVATNCPAHSEYLIDMGGLALRGRVPPGEHGALPSYAPRRGVLDSLLLDAAIAAGVEVHDRCTARNLIIEDGRVAGLRYTSADGKSGEARARIVIGADGVNSAIATLTGAKEYSGRPKAEQTFFSYFAGTKLSLVTFFSRPGRMGFVWPTNDGEVVAGFCCRLADCDRMKREVETGFWREVEAISPSFAASLRAGRQTTRIRMGGTRAFMRQAGGPGWALTGDAGLNMDPISAQGISNALVQAEMLAAAIDDGLNRGTLDKEVAAFGTGRDQRFGGLYEFTAEMAMLEPELPEEVVRLFMSLSGNQPDTDAYFGIFGQTVAVADFFDPANVQRIVARHETDAVVK